MPTDSTTQPDINYNPMGTDGFEFVEFTAKDPSILETIFTGIGFTKIAKHRSKNVYLYRQGQINFILNMEPKSQAENFAGIHGASVNAMAFRVRDSMQAVAHAMEKGAEIVESKIGPMELNIPAIKGIGGSLIYLVDAYNGLSIYDVDFVPLEGVGQHPKGNGLTYIDHLTHNVFRGHMDEWAGFYERIFNFREIRYFDIEGKLTGLISRAMTSPCGKIRIPINESADDKSQIEEFLEEYHGEGIQHIALGTDDIYETVEGLRAKKVEFMSVPATYYTMLPDRLPHHGENIKRLEKNSILVDGATDDPKDKRLLLQIFTKPVIGPVFFEIIQRKGDDGFGEGNFRALFESIERDQIERGVLK